jgi:hypothetical protein
MTELYIIEVVIQFLSGFCSRVFFTGRPVSEKILCRGFTFQQYAVISDSGTL